tara:strand:+ start:22163 stop:22390 length:228 start_codon:yes stop_codon:yes gene_type:complete
MKESIKKIMANTFEININDISEESSPNDFESWDSLRHLMLIVNLEEKFQIKFSDEELVSLVDFKNIYQIISKKMI